MSKKVQSGKLTANRNYLELFTTLVSVLALVISIKSCVQAEHSLEIAKKEFNSQRLAIWQGTIEENSRLVLSPVAEGINLQTANIYFPPQIDKTVYTASAPDYSVSLMYLSLQLQNFIESTIKPDGKSVVVGKDSIVPIIIESNYIAQGTLYQEVALYYIKSMFIVGASDTENPTITFDGLLFGYRLDLETDIHKYLQEEWNRITALPTDTSP